MRRANKRATVVYSTIAAGLLLITIFLLHPPGAVAYDFKAFKNAGGAKCALNGTVRPLNRVPGDKGFKSLKNKLRLSFDADDHKKCERYLTAYCRHNILGRRDVPVNLDGFFRPADAKDGKPSHKYTLTEDCKLIIEPV